MFSYGVDIARLPDVTSATEPPADAGAELKAQLEHAEELLARLETLSMPRLMIGAKPYVFSVTIILAAMAAGQLINGYAPTLLQFKSLELRWREIGIYAGIAGMSLLILGVILRFVGKSQAKKVFLPMRQAIANSRQAMKVKMDRAHEDRESRRQRANRRREMEVQAAKDKFTPAVAKMASFRDKTHVTRENPITPSESSAPSSSETSRRRKWISGRRST